MGTEHFSEGSLFWNICIESRSLEWGWFNSGKSPPPQVRGPETNLKWEKTTLQIPIRLPIKISRSGKSQLTCPLLWQIAQTMGLVQTQKFSVGSSNHRSSNLSKSAVLGWSDKKTLATNKCRAPCTLHRKIWNHLPTFSICSLLLPFPDPALPVTLEKSYGLVDFHNFHTRYFS